MTSPVPFQTTTSNASGAPTGTPEWWVHLLVWRLMNRQRQLDYRDAYVEGYSVPPGGDPSAFKALQELSRVARTNYCGLVHSAAVERMRVRGFRFGPVGQADEDAKRIWGASDGDVQASYIHNRGAKFGVTYALVSPPSEPGGDPVFTAESPRTCITYQDPLRPTKSVAGLKMWADDEAGEIRAVLYLPDRIYGLTGPPIAALTNMDYHSLRERLLGGYGTGLQFAGSVENTIGEVPMVQYTWRPDSGKELPEGEVGEDVRMIQDRINHSILSRLLITETQAYRQRYATGVKIPTGKKGQKKSPHEPGASTVWVNESPDAKYGDFDVADISQVLEAIRDDVADIAAITKTPPHYLMGKMANVSGETLSQAEAGLVSKVRMRQTTVGWGHEQLMKLCFLYLGNAEKAKDVVAMTLWADPQQYDMAELADAAAKWSGIGIPLELIMERQGWSPDDIEFAIQERDRIQQQELEQQQQVADQAHSQALELQASAPKPTTPRGK